MGPIIPNADVVSDAIATLLPLGYHPESSSPTLYSQPLRPLFSCSLGYPYPPIPLTYPTVAPRCRLALPFTRLATCRRYSAIGVLMCDGISRAPLLSDNSDCPELGLTKRLPTYRAEVRQTTTYVRSLLNYQSTTALKFEPDNV